MHIVNLASGSKANSTLIETEKTKILIDAGLREKELERRLNEVGTSLSQINAIFVTHEHSDHIKALPTLAKKYDMQFFVHEELAKSGLLQNINFKEQKLLCFSNNTAKVGDLLIEPFNISHDAVCPVGFVVSEFKSKSKAGFVTDLGIVTETVKNALSGSKIVFIESNHDKQMLLSGNYPPRLKARIAGKYGHLSNAQALELADWLYKRGTKCFILSHLSENNNSPRIAYGEFANFFESQGLVLDKDVFIRLSFQDKHGNNFSLKKE